MTGRLELLWYDAIRQHNVKIFLYHTNEFKTLEYSIHVVWYFGVVVASLVTAATPSTLTPTAVTHDRRLWALREATSQRVPGHRAQPLVPLLLSRNWHTVVVCRMLNV